MAAKIPGFGTSVFPRCLVLVPAASLALQLLLQASTAHGAPNNNTVAGASSRTFDSNMDHTRFLNNQWKLWDKPGDQVAMEGSGKDAYINPMTDNDILQKYSKSYQHSPYGMQRQDCNSDVQVALYPVIAVLIAVVSGVIAIFIIWIVARKFAASDFTSSSGGWSKNQRQFEMDLMGFQNMFKNFDLNQLTKSIITGLEKYKELAEDNSGNF